MSLSTFPPKDVGIWDNFIGKKLSLTSTIINIIKLTHAIFEI